jgi:hypothetical protein
MSISSPAFEAQGHRRTEEVSKVSQGTQFEIGQEAGEVRWGVSVVKVEKDRVRQEAKKNGMDEKMIDCHRC